MSELVGRYPQEQDDNLVEQLHRALALAAVLESEFKSIRNKSMSYNVHWSSNVESLLAHLEIDLSWLRAEFKQIRG